MKMFSREQKGSFYAITSGLCFGLVGYFGLSLMDTNVSVSNMQFWRFLISMLVMLFILMPQYKTFDDNAVEVLKAFFSGVFFYSTSTGIYFSASKYIGTGLAVVIFFTFPVFVMLLNWLLYRTKIDKIYYLSVILIILGMVHLVDLNDLKLDMIGIGLAVLGAMIYACYIVSSKRIKVSSMVSTLMISLGCSVACLIFSLYDESFFIPSTSFQWIHILGFGILSTALPILLLLQGLKKISAEKASILSVMEPVFVVIFGIILLDETITTTQMIGVVTILSGAIITLSGNNLKNHIFYHKVKRLFEQIRNLEK